MSSRPGVMNAQQAKGMRDAGLVQIGGTRQGLGAIDRIGRYMMPQKPFRDIGQSLRCATRDRARRKGRPADHQRV